MVQLLPQNRPTILKQNTWEYIEKYGYDRNNKSADTVIFETFQRFEQLEKENEQLYLSYNQLQAKFDALLKEHLAMVNKMTNGDSNDR